MSKTKKILAVTAGALVIVLISVYIGLTIYYQKNFKVNTWINGVYCTGRSVQEVNEILLENTQKPDQMRVTGYDRLGADAQKVEYSIALDTVGRQLEYESALNDYIRNNNGGVWFKDLTLVHESELTPQILFDEALLRQWLDDSLGKLYTEEDYRIDYQEGKGYSLYDGINRRIDMEKAYLALQEAIIAGEDHVDLIEKECYYDVPPTSAQQEAAKLWMRINDFQNNGPIYDFRSENEEADAGLMAGFLVKQENSDMPLMTEEEYFVVDEEKITQWLADIALKYDTYGKTWSFVSTRGETLEVPAGTYGTTIDQKHEILWLKGYMDELATGVIPGDRRRVPDYTKGSYEQSGLEIGDTYVEVDMGLQKLYFHEAGEIKLESDIVTGNARRRMNTPEGVYFVYSKQKNRVLRGENYASPVKFWMPVVKAIGIHDARWRDEFGGEIYKTNGSHGCVNVPLETAEELYDLIEIGTPVIMFYGEDPYVQEENTSA